MPPYVFKEHSERTSSTEIKLLTWNSKYDLLALADFKGDVCLQRIFWRKAWDYANPFVSSEKSLQQKNDQSTTSESKIQISNFCWSPRGDCLCVCYTNSRCHFLDIENGKLVHEICLNDEFPDRNSEILVKWRQSDEINFGQKFPDLVAENWKINNSNEIGSTIFKKNNEKNRATFDSIFLNIDYANFLTVLILARRSTIDLYLNGYLHFYALNLEQDDWPILDLQFTPNFDAFLFLTRTNSALHCYKINLHKFRRRIADVSSFVERSGKSMTWSRNANQCLKSILDSFQDILKDLTTKFRRFARDKFFVDENSTIGDEFMNVLAFGTFSPELQTFLTQDLNDKNLKKLSLNLENTYANLRKSISSWLIASLSNLFYHLNELNEFSRSNFPLFDDRNLQSLLAVCQTTILKSRRTLDVLDSSLEDFRLFSSWLTKICLIIMSSSSLEEERNQNQKQQQQNFDCNDLQRILNFIRENFQVKYDNAREENCDQNLFKIEKIGQYLADAELSDEIDGFDKEHSRTSLVQDIKILNQKFRDFLNDVSKNVARSDWFEIQKIQSWPSSSLVENSPLPQFPKNASIKFDSRRQIFRLFFYDDLNSKIEIYEQQVHQNNRTKILTDFFVKKIDFLCPENFFVENFCDYNANSSCFLISDRRKSPSSTTTTEPTIKYKIGIVDDKIFDDYCSGRSVNLENNENIRLQNLKSGPFCQWAVSGSRKIACVLYACRTRLKLLEMDPDEMSSASSFELVDQEEAMSVQ